MLNSEQRDIFYARHRKFHHTFHYEDSDLEYALYGTLGISFDFHNDLIEATEQMAEIMHKVKESVKTLSPRDLVRLGFDSRIIPFLNLDHLANHNVTARFDVINDNGVPKFIEVNNDTPFLLMENFLMDEALVRDAGKLPLTVNRKGMLTDSLLYAIEDSAEYLEMDVRECTVAILGVPREVDLEEYTNMTFLAELIADAGIRVTYLDYSELMIDRDNGEVYSDKTGIIDILLKLAYPYEFLLDDTYEHQSGSIGVDLMQMMKDKKVALINPPSTHILQHKSTFAYLWELVERRNFFDSSEEEFIRKHVPYTTLNKNYFTSKLQDYVIKPSISREGQSVKIVRDGEVSSSKINNYDDQTLIYQELVNLPKRTVTVRDEDKELLEVLGVFVIGTNYAGTVCRLGGEITDGDSHWISLTTE